MQDIIISGSIAYDHVMSFPGYFKNHFLTDNLDSYNVSIHQGGTAPNIAFSHAMLGGNASVLGTVGRDFEPYRVSLDEAGVNTSNIVEIQDDFTASFYVTTDLDNSQITFFYPGAMSYSSKLKIKDLARKPDLVVISPDDPVTMKMRVRECQSLRIPYFYDPSQDIARLDSDEIYQGVSGSKFIMLNSYEFSLLNDKLGMSKRDIVDLGTLLVVTNGKHGLSIWSSDDHLKIPVYPADIVRDPTGAGDAFRGGFLRAYALDMSLELCGKVGALCATYCVEHVGTQNHHYTVSEFIDRFRVCFDDAGELDALLNNNSTG
ncbi:MAG: ribokinase [Anaerolineaceae bacterium]|nr:ribokinase [Anaerolineaceae bacterium]|tara:strand:+ start:905 stop:1858 length:954 start_codon:yes stop_codon:yes gene_type:complete